MNIHLKVQKFFTSRTKLTLMFFLVLVGLPLTLILLQAPQDTRGMAASNCPASLQSLVDNATAGAVIQVPNCVYRETVRIDKSLTLDGQGQAEIRGSDVWTGWTQQGNYWVSTLQVPSWYTHGECVSGTNRCLLAEQVFLDEQPLMQVAANPIAGQFAVNSTRQVVLFDNPTTRTVEVTTRQFWVDPKSDNVTVQNFIMKHSAIDAQWGAITVYNVSNSTIQNNILSDAHGAVVSMQGGTNNKLLNNDISRGGQLGVHANSAGFLMEGNKIHDNNTEDFSPGWEAGGVKTVGVTNLVANRNEVYNNNGTGLWCDIDCANITYSFNNIHHNTGKGIWFELSDGAKIYNNTVWKNNWDYTVWGWGAGIIIANSSNAEVYNNTVAWNPDGISVLSQNRGETHWNDNHNNYVHDNTIFMWDDPLDTSDKMSLGWMQDWTGVLFSSTANNRGMNNKYWFNVTDGRWCMYRWNACIGTLANFNTTPGEENGRYLTNTEKDQILTNANIPLCPTCSLSVSPTPTSTPSIVPSLTPTNSPSATPTLTPTPTVTLTPTPATVLDLTLKLHGVGTGGDSVNPTSTGNTAPITPQRPITLAISNITNVTVANVSGTISYDTTTGIFTGSAVLPSLASGSYVVKVTTPKYLTKTLPGIQTITQNQTTSMPTAALVAGDVNNDNAINILDYNLIMDCYSDLTPPRSCDDLLKKQASDIDDDGKVNQYDYNLFIRELSVKSGE